MIEYFKKKEENTETVENKNEKKGFNLSFSMFKNIISKTQNAISDNLSEIVSSKQEINDDMLYKHNGPIYVPIRNWTHDLFEVYNSMYDIRKNNKEYKL